MSRWMPTVQEERVALARRRAGVADRGIRWRGVALVPRVIFFALTLVCLQAATGLLSLVGLPWALAGGVTAIVIGEALIVRKRLYHAGPDDALWTAGLGLLIVALPASAAPEGLLLVTVACVVAGARLRNGLVLAASLPVVCVYVDARLGDRGVGSILALAVACVAVALARREWSDPLAESVLSWSIVAMPLVAYALDVSRHGVGGAWRARVMLAVAVAAVLVVTGVRQRHRPTVVAGALCLIAASVDVDRRLNWPGEIRFVAWGVALLALTLVVTRVLRRQPGGITAERIGDVEGYRLAEIAAAAAAVPRGLPSGVQPLDKGGRYGGGGASGDF